jgi:uncharacterized protein (TIRG00374 family)
VTTIPVPRLRLRYLLWLAAPLLLLVMLRQVSPGQAWSVLSQLRITQILALIAANGLVLLILSGRWWVILRSQGYAIPYLTLAGYRLVAFGINYFTPGPQFGGEPLQVYLVQRRHRVPPATAMASVTLDKLLELLSNFTFLAAGAICILECQVLHGVAGSPSILLGAALLVLPVGVLAALWAGWHPLSRLLQAGFHLLPQTWLERKGWLAAYHDISQAIRESENQTTRLCRERPLAVVQALLFSALGWAAMIGEYWLALHFLGQSLTLAQTISALTAARIAFLMPLPGGLGALEASQVLAMGALGINPAVGISLSLLIRVRDVALGGLGLWWGGLKSIVALREKLG